MAGDPLMAPGRGAMRSLGLVAIILGFLAGCGEDSANSEAFEGPAGEVSPIAVVGEWFPVVIGDTVVLAEAGTTVTVEVPVQLVVGDSPEHYAVTAQSENAYLPTSPTELTVGPDSPGTIVVDIDVPLGVGDWEVVDVLVDPTGPTWSDSGTGTGGGRIIVESVEVGTPLPPIAVPDAVALSADVRLDVLANDTARQGALDPTTLRVTGVESNSLTGEDVTVDDEGRLRLLHPGPFDTFYDGAIVVYEICDTEGACAEGFVWLWLRQDT